MLRVLLSLCILFSVNLPAHSQDNVSYESEHLKIIQLSSNTFVHISYLHYEKYGKVGCNGMIYINKGEALIFDTPTDNEATKELIQWVELESEVKAVVATHFHIDCLGGLDMFHEKEIPSYASALTVALAKKADEKVLPQNVFDTKLKLKAGGKKTLVQYFGEGHTRDNVVVYIPSEETLFGGCLVKGYKAGKGNLNDANTDAWPATIRMISKKYPKLEVVIPGHGKTGGTELLDYTIEMFTKNKAN